MKVLKHETWVTVIEHWEKRANAFSPSAFSPRTNKNMNKIGPKYARKWVIGIQCSPFSTSGTSLTRMKWLGFDEKCYFRTTTKYMHRWETNGIFNHFLLAGLARLAWHSRLDVMWAGTTLHRLIFLYEYDSVKLSPSKWNDLLPGIWFQPAWFTCTLKLIQNTEIILIHNTHPLWDFGGSIIIFSLIEWLQNILAMHLLQF